MENMPFKKLGLALTFSPSMKYNLSVGLRLKKLFNAELCIIHSASAKQEDKDRLEQMLVESKCDLTKIKLISKEGDPAKVILESTEEEKVDLLIAGALVKESLLNHYIGSVSRKLMNEAKCSVLILKKSVIVLNSFKKFCVIVNYSSESEKAVTSSYKFAELENAGSFCLIRDLWIPGLSLSGLDSGFTNDADSTIKDLLEDETLKMNLLVKELNLSKKVPIEISCFYEKNALDLSNYVRENKADLLVFSTPVKKTSIFNRFVTDELKNIYDDLPSNLLIIR